VKKILSLLILIFSLSFAELKLSKPFVQTMHSGVVTSIEVKNRYIVTSDSVGVVKIWDFNKRKLLKTINISNNKIVSLSMFNSSILILDISGNVYLYNISNFKIIKKVKLFSQGVKVLANNKYIVAIGDSNVIKVLNSKLDTIKVFDNNKYPIKNADIKNNKLITTGRIVKTWDLDKLKLTKTIPTKSHPNNVKIFNNNSFALYSTYIEPLNNREPINIFIYNSNATFDKKYPYYLDNIIKIDDNMILNSAISNDKKITYFKKHLNSNKTLIKKEIKHNCVIGQIDSSYLHNNSFLISFSDHYSEFPEGHLNTISIFNNNKQYSISKELFDIRDITVDDKYLYILYSGVRVYNSKVLVFNKQTMQLVKKIEPKDTCFVDRIASYDNYFFYSHGCSDSRELRFWDFYKKGEWKLIGSMLEEDYDDGEEIIKTSKYYNNKKLRAIATKKLSYFESYNYNSKIEKKFPWIKNIIKKKDFTFDTFRSSFISNDNFILLANSHNIIVFNKNSKKELFFLKNVNVAKNSYRVDTSKKGAPKILCKSNL